MKKPLLSLWIFCQVIDNFGDIGVAYRLARQLNASGIYHISLWVNKLSSLKRLENRIKNCDIPQQVEGIDVLPWQNKFLQKKVNDKPPQVIIEAFACFSEHKLEICFNHPPLHIVLEYLSLETWTLSYHLQPSLGYHRKFFYFLGVLPESGGLLVEKDYQTKEKAFKKRFTSSSVQKRVFLFAYPSFDWEKWLSSWDQLHISYQLHIVRDQISQNLPKQRLAANNIKLLDFTNQIIFDEHLWQADIAIVRGEDSFVRAQLAGLPFFWHSYPQKNYIHLAKIEAFCQITKPYYREDIYQAWHTLMMELNGKSILTHTQRIEYFHLLWQNIEHWRNGTQLWSNFLLSQSSACERLSHFIKKQLK